MIEQERTYELLLALTTSLLIVTALQEAGVTTAALLQRDSDPDDRVLRGEHGELLKAKTRK